MHFAPPLLKPSWVQHKGHSCAILPARALSVLSRRRLLAYANREK